MMGNLNLFIEAMARLESRGITVEAKRCTRLRHRIASCTRCSEVCPTQAIQWGEDSLDIDPDKCTGCGACATVCPTAALEAKAPSDLQLHSATKALANEIGEVAFACERSLKKSSCDRSRVIEVPCIARIDESVLIGAVVAGARSVQLVDQACSSCAHGKAREVAVKTAELANALLIAWGKSKLVEFGQPTNASGNTREEIRSAEGISRRGFFTLLKGESAEVASGAIAGVVGGAIKGDQKERPRKISYQDFQKHIPGKRRYLLAALNALGQPVAQELSTSLWAKVTIAHNCKGCWGCVDFCPTGALAKFQYEGQIGIAYQAFSCASCRLCEDICQRAIRSGSLTVTQPADLMKVLQPTTEVLIVKPMEQFIQFDSKLEDKLAALLHTTVASYS